MKNKKYDGIIYNEKVKEQFLDEYIDETAENYRRIFIRSHIIESVLERDIYDFNIKEIENLLHHLSPTTLPASRGNISIVSSYIDWAIENGYRGQSINPIKYQFDDWAEKFVPEEVPYYSKEQIEEALSKTKNAQDRAIILLLFYGLSGDEISEIRNLKMSDVFEIDGFVKAVDKDGSIREVQLPKVCFEAIKEAARQDIYLINNGVISPTARNSKGERELIETGYVIKPNKGRAKEEGTISYHTIRSRLETLSELLEMEHLKKYISIKRSGMIWMGKQLLERDGEVAKEQLIEICEQYGISEVLRNGKMERQWHQVREYVNEDMIRKLYS